MARMRPGWFVVVFAALLAGSAWLPWLTTSAQGGGRASAIGGTIGSLVLPPRFGAGQLIVLLASALIVTGSMAARNLSPRLAATAALVISALIGLLTWWYYHLNVSPPVSAGYGFYVGAAGALAAVICSVWALVVALLGAPTR
jgi:hypothetical protein